MLVGISLPQQSRNTDTQDDQPGHFAELLNAVAVKKCQRSFSELFQYFAPRLRSYALGLTKNESQAMELVQETMANVWQKSHLFNQEKGSASTWIFTIARNQRFDMLRKLQSRKDEVSAEDLWPVLEYAATTNAQEQLDEQLTVEQAASLFSQLPEKQRVVVEAIYLQGMAQQDVADSLQIPLGTVKSRTRLALQRLKQLLEDD